MGGMSSKTLTDLIIAPGAYVTVATVDMGALVETIEVNVSMERYFPDLYGAKGNIKGTGHINRAICQVTFRMAEWEYAKFVTIWNQIGTSTDANSEKVGDGTLGKIADADYAAVVILGFTLHDDKPVQVELDNAFLANDPSFSLSDREDSFIEVTMESAYLVTAPTTAPFNIQMDKG